MGNYIGFILSWLLVMGLIGIALKLVSHIGKKKAEENGNKKEETQDIADE